MAFRSRSQSVLTLLLLVLAAALTLYVPLDRAAELRTTPDSIEYVAGARSLAAGGAFVVRPGELALPPRYPPWLGWLLAPVFLLGDHPGLAILPISLAALACLLLCRRLATDLGGDEAGLVAAVLLLALPVFRFWSAEVMSDLPALAFGLWGLRRLALVTERDRPEGALDHLSTGLVLAAAFLLRPAMVCLGLSAVVALVWRWGPLAALPRLIWMALPPAIGGLATFLWNFVAYGSATRNGYQFWVASIYDHPEILFPSGAVTRNLTNLLDTGWPQLAAGALGLLLLLGLVRAWRPPGLDLRRATRFALIVLAFALPYLWLHLRYYSGRPRYYLPLFPPVIALGAGLGLPVLRRHARAVALLALVLAMVFALRQRSIQPEHPRQGRYAETRALMDRSPTDVLILSALPPDYLRLVAGAGDRRHYLLLSRDEEYASKTTTRSLDGRLVSRPAVARTADEDRDAILAALASGRPVYLQMTELWRHASRDFLAWLEQVAVLETVGPGVVRLRARD
ncbi:MAG: glycosyltransferase family 39 protein [Planctomycetes bacterium]|nr:glycosyltransferase family 39 protein [Planctomycetota bacterium]